MQLHFDSMTEAAAEQIGAWCYEPPYDLYNLGTSVVAALLAPANRYFAAVDHESQVIGFCCFGLEGRVPGGAYDDDSLLDVGVGLRPDLTGRRLGPQYLVAVLAFGMARYAPIGFRATVAAFNKRSIRACEKAGFKASDAFRRGNDPDGMPFVILTWFSGER
ncbi:MAG: GNAT family N-acetyltransferase [Dehalococcoidia bacterium]